MNSIKQTVFELANKKLPSLDECRQAVQDAFPNMSDKGREALSRVVAVMGWRTKNHMGFYDWQAETPGWVKTVYTQNVVVTNLTGKAHNRTTYYLTLPFEVVVVAHEQMAKRNFSTWTYALPQAHSGFEFGPHGYTANCGNFSAPL